MKHLISLHDLTKEEFEEIFHITGRLKKYVKEGKSHEILKGKTLGMIFTKSSTRTRVSFEVGMYQLGGYPLFLSSNDIQIGRGETIEDTAKVLSRYIDCIMIRTYDHRDVYDLARYGSIPVINGLTDLMHPCQALADLFTILEHKGKLRGLKLAYIGDGNNMAHSLLHGCVKVGMDISVATPGGYECDGEMVKEAMDDALLWSGEGPKPEVLITNDPVEAIKDADVVYTDTWISMGQESDKEEKIKAFKDYRIDEKLFSHARQDAIFLHCLPAYRGYEVDSSIIDGPRSVVFDEAENRLHVQKAIMTKLMKGVLE